MILLLSLLHLCVAYCNCPAVGVEPWVLATLGKWVVLVTMKVYPMLVVLVAALLIVPSPVEWGKVSQVVMQVSPRW